MPRFFPTKDDALKYMAIFNRMEKQQTSCVVEIKGKGNFAVIDLKTARDLGCRTIALTTRLIGPMKELSDQ